jgi:hypothetical protein
MTDFVLFKPDGEIVAVGNCSPEAFDLQQVEGLELIEAQADPDKDRIDPQTRAVLPGANVKPKPPESYARIRARMYPSIADQLDMLWHAMDRGDMPVAEPFYSSIKMVKNAVPKVTEHIFDVGGL